MKRTIRLTESDLHRIVSETVNRVLAEGQGWNTFKDAWREYRGMDDDDKERLSQEWGNDDWKQKTQDYIQHGDMNYMGPEFDEREYYEPDGMATHNGPEDGNKPINKSLRGRLGRRAAMAGVNAIGRYNKMRQGVKDAASNAKSKYWG